jgi:cytochrome c554/c'-like protein
MVLRRMSAVVVFAGLVSGVAAAQTPSTDYAWAAACKDCHAGYYAAWDKTKHAHAIMRLSADDRSSGKCVRCHVTGATELAAADVNANIQCEACHGAGKAHIAAAASGNTKPRAITRTPEERVCVQCHNDTGPHFKFFSYGALAPLVHVVVK